jgi:hypothetical protein
MVIEFRSWFYRNCRCVASRGDECWRRLLAMSQNYKDTLNLPRTDFPMKANLAVREPEDRDRSRERL